VILSLDTNILVDLLRTKDPDLKERFLSRSPGEYAVSEIARAELLHGAGMSRNPKENVNRVEALLAPLALIPFEGRAASAYGEIKAELQRKGLLIGANDLLIAASALSLGHCLVTRNTREFKRVPGLIIEEWL